MVERDDRARVRVSLVDGELEIEGSEAFIAGYADALEALIARVNSDGFTARFGGGGADNLGRSRAEREELTEFPEALHKMSSASGTDQILLAGSFAAKGHADRTFQTGEANALLLEQGVKLANASQSMANNLKAKRVFKVGKAWKISRGGEDYLRTLVS